MDKKEHELMYSFITDFWAFIKAYWVIYDSDDWWDSIVKQGNLLADKYASEDPETFRTIKALIVAFMKEQERKAREHEQTAKEDGRQAG
ncbi:MAG TPA: hypothetical protein DCG37_06960 [Lachnospiraceae bacterium]|jgi:hypothetical protein|nr:hypothetical protein [Lachnospiraceae bacterium]